MSSSILEINRILNEYSSEIQEAIALETEKVAKEALEELKVTSPVNKRNSKHKGKYSKGWKVKITKGRGFVNTKIYNSTNWQLTHLLENGHLTRNGSKTKPIKHIEPIEKKYKEEYEKRVKKIIENGG